MTNERATTVDGTLIRGADGALYFIPDTEIEAYRVPEQPADDAAKGAGDTAGHQLTRPLGPEFSVLSALRGPLGVRANDDEPTISKVATRGATFLS